MNKFAFAALFAVSFSVLPVSAQDAPVAPATSGEDLSQFSPAQQFGYGMFMLSKHFVEILDTPEAQQNPDAAAEKIDALTETARSLFELAPKVDKAELQDILSKLLVTEEYNDVQSRGSLIGKRLISTEYYGSEKLKTAVQTFFFTVMGLQQQAM